jgi:hypothetical protein
MRTSMMLLLLLPILVSGCGGTDDGEAAAPEKAVQAAAIADEIAADPDSFDQVLTKHGMTAEQFQDLMFEIAEDDVLSAAYEAARKVPDPQ